LTSSIEALFAANTASVDLVPLPMPLLGGDEFVPYTVFEARQDHQFVGLD
jgi:hypothetical protein